MKKTGILAVAFVLSGPLSGHAGEVRLTPDRDFIDVLHLGKMVRVERIQDPDNVIPVAWGKTARNCPPFCIHPMQAAPDVRTVGEIEIFEFMEQRVNMGKGVLVDARLPSWHQRGTIPGSVNIPFTTLEHEPTAPETAAALEKLGAVPRTNVGGLTRFIEKPLGEFGLFGADLKTEHWDFTQAKEVLLWCNGPWCDQSPRAIKALLRLGYPIEKISYYRGGMQLWQLLGLTTVIPE